jgi:hypothetical protein
VSTFDDETELEFFEEPETLESPDRPRRRIRPPRPGGPRRPSPPPPGAVALARLAGFVALAIAVVIGFVFWVGSCQGKSKHDEYSSYMKDLQAIAQDSAAPGRQFENVFVSRKLTVAGLESKFQQWSRQEQQDYNDTLRLRPPGPLQSAHQQALGAFQMRAIGLTGLADALARAGTKDASDVADSLATQAQLLSASDLVWSNLFHLPATQTLTNVGVKGVIAPSSQIVTNPEVLSSGSFELVYQRLSATKPGGHVTGLHGSELLKVEAVSGSSVHQLSTSTATTVDVGPKLAFRVTFEDSGNFPESQVPVTITVTVFGKQVFTKRQVVKSIASKATTSVSFGNLDLPPSAFGSTARVKVEIAKVPGETHLENNSASYQVFFSLPAGG